MQSGKRQDHVRLEEFGVILDDLARRSDRLFHVAGIDRVLCVVRAIQRSARVDLQQLFALRECLVVLRGERVQNGKIVIARTIGRKLVDELLVVLDRLAVVQ